MNRRLAGELLRLPVKTRDITIGRAVDVIVDPVQNRAVGFDVLCGDGGHRFLPFPTARLDGDHVEVDSSLMLLEREQLEFYKERGRALRS